jgi:hypothetical protein
MMRHVCRAVTETNLDGLQFYPWLGSWSEAAMQLARLKAAVAAQPSAKLIQAYVECALAYLT